MRDFKDIIRTIMIFLSCVVFGSAIFNLVIDRQFYTWNAITITEFVVICFWFYNCCNILLFRIKHYLVQYKKEKRLRHYYVYDLK